ncbi:MAG TPA: START domain-containing protein [Clostridiales bacterium]|nr:START domain-containing protein [Clostridiales bacterium]
MKNLIFLILIFFVHSALLCDWKLQKSSPHYKAYTKDGEGKEYRVEAVIRASADSVYKFLTGFEKFPEYYDNISSIKIIDSNDSSAYHYTVINTPWPLKDRDMVTKIIISKNKDKITLNSRSVTDPEFPESDKLIRVNGFKEQLEIEVSGNNKTVLKITGSMKITEKVPSWVIDKLILTGPVKTVEILEKLYGIGE